MIVRRGVIRRSKLIGRFTVATCQNNLHLCARKSILGLIFTTTTTTTRQGRAFIQWWKVLSERMCTFRHYALLRKWFYGSIKQNERNANIFGDSFMYLVSSIYFFNFSHCKHHTNDCLHISFVICVHLCIIKLLCSKRQLPFIYCMFSLDIPPFFH